MSYSKSRKGFTLIEILVVIAVIAILIGLLVPAVQKVRAAAAVTQCQNNLKQIGLALHSYEGTNKFFPPAYTRTSDRTSGTSFGITYPDDGSNGLPGWGWGVLILPYLEQGSLYGNLQFNLPCWAPANAPLVKTKLSIFLCPASTGPSDGFALHATPSAVNPADAGPFSPTIYFAHSHYVTNAGQNGPWNRPAGTTYDFAVPVSPASPGAPANITNGPFFRNSCTRIAQITDGTSNTVFIGEGDSVLTNRTWVGVVPGVVQRRRSRRPVRATPIVAAPWSGLTAARRDRSSEYDHPCTEQSVRAHRSNVEFASRAWRKRLARRRLCPLRQRVY